MVKWLSGVVALLLAVEVEAVRLRWDAPAVGVADGYSMYRYTVPGGLCGAPITPSFELIGSVLAGAELTFVDNAAIIGANYYHVTAYNSGGESLPSNQVCFQAAQRPSAPVNLRVE